jgi:aryl-alcohol dehydrogenase-like predicted oxidoreductase
LAVRVKQMTKLRSETPNPRRQAAGRLNWLKRRGFTLEGLARLRAAALAVCPWKHSTGPLTAAGKAKVAENGRRRQKGPLSVRELRAELAEAYGVLRELQELRKSLGEYNAKHGVHGSGPH